jgi:sorbitol-specific phosphotransferase system component IIBC
VLVRSQDDLKAYRTLFGARRFVAYVPTAADPALFALAKQAGASVLTDSMSGGDAAPDTLAAKDGVAAYRRYLADRPVDILVTDHAERLPACAALR